MSIYKTITMITASIIILALLAGCGQAEPTPAPAATPIPPTSTPNPPTATPVPPTATPKPPTAPLSFLDDGGRGVIALSSNIDGSMDIYVMAVPDGDEPETGSGAWHRLTHHRANDTSPAWSPDGAQIAFVSERDGNPEIYVMNVEDAFRNADDSGLQRLTDNAANDVGPAWSPDGTQVAFSSDRDGDAEIYVVNADGSGERQLTDNDADDENPTWSPDGAQIAFASRRDGVFREIYVMGADGADQRRLTDNEANDHYPNWSPDGAQIVFSYDEGGDSEIYVMDADGGNRRQVTDHAGATDWWPHWSPDGAQIVFCALEQANFEYLHDVYVVDADGGHTRKLTADTADTWWPAWRP